jgi:hypothetical protein
LGIGSPIEENIVWSDDFAAGFSIGPIGGAKWNLHERGSFRPNDGVVTVDEYGLNVVPIGVNPWSGEPAFTQTLAPSPPGADVPGVLDHMKWVAFTDHQSSKGVTGFDTPSGKTLQVEATMRGRTYGTERHPFGEAVREVYSDFRLGAPAMVNIDKETNVVFSFFLTNNSIFAMYERPPFARDKLGHYAAFSFAVPVGSREPDDWHKLAVSYDHDSNTARWLVDEAVVLEVDRVGRRIDRRYMIIDVGGDEQIVRLDQLACGLGMFTLMDASLNGGPGLIDLYGYPVFFCTARGAPHPLRYVDRESLPANRLFGQGAQVRCKSFSVSYR